MYTLAIIGATGLVGRNVIDVLNEKDLPNLDYKLFASYKSVGKELEIKGKKYKVEELKENSFDDKMDFAIFVAGSDVSQKYIPMAMRKNIICIDNSRVFRMENYVPLVVPEVNKEKIKNNNGIIANPNCSTIQAVVALKPLDDKYKIKRIVYSTYQAVSGAGKMGVDDFKNGILGKKPKKFPYQIFNNCLPQIDEFLDDGYTKEEMKMINETKKILDNQNLRITATAVRVPVINCHGESINVEFENDFDINELRNVLANSQGIIVQDDIKNNLYPLATNANKKNEVFVGRIRRDYSVPYGINMWVVADNLRKGAATNAVQILEELIKERK